jgi:hypothetical protein
MNAIRYFAAAAALVLLGGLTPALSQDKLLVPGDPPLTQEAVNLYRQPLEWALDIRLTEPQRQQWQQLFIREWNKKPRTQKQELIAGWRSGFKWYGDLPGMTETRRRELREAKRAAYVDLLRRSSDQDDRMLIAIYDAAHRPGGTKNPIRVAGSAPFVMVAQQHNVEQKKKKGVLFHVTAQINNRKGQPCTLGVVCFDTTGKNIKALRKEFGDSNGWLLASSPHTPKYDYNQVQAQVFLPYDVITAAGGLQEIQIVGNVWDDTARKWLATTPFKAACWFNPNASKEEARQAAKRFEQERELVTLALKLNAQRRQAEVTAFLETMRRDAERREQEAREEQRRADRRYADRRDEQRRADQMHADRLAEQRRADQRHADRLAELRRDDQRHADRLAGQRRDDQRRADQLAEQRRADQRRADQLAAQRRADELAAQRRAEEARRRP